MFEELEHVVLMEDLDDHGLKADDIGMILHVYGQGEGYEVEFVTLGSELVALVALTPSHIRAVEQDEMAQVRRVHAL